MEETVNRRALWMGLLSIFVLSPRTVEEAPSVSSMVKAIVVDRLGVDPKQVTETARFIDDLGADSLDTVELVMAFEEEFSCEIPDDACSQTMLTVGDAIKFLATCNR